MKRLEELPELSREKQKQLARLTGRKARAKEGRMLVEGARLVEEAAACDANIEWAAVTERAGEREAALVSALTGRGVPVFRTSAGVFDRALATATPQAVAAVCRSASRCLADIGPGAKSLLVVSDGISEPGNLGSVIRSAAAAGAGGVIAAAGTVDISNPKVLRGAMGASFRIPVVEEADTAEIQSYLERGGFSLFTAAADGEDIFSIAKPPPRAALVLGSEARGSRSFPGAKPLAIPMSRGVESLNVAVACGIILYHMAGMLGIRPAAPDTGE